MPRRSAEAMGEWVRALGEQIGTQLGIAIAENVQRVVLSRVDVGEMARRLGGGNGRRSRSGEKPVCREAGCPNPVLAKGMCRSHYYRARYRAQKAGVAGRRGNGRRRGRKGKSDSAAASGG